ncbi:hypothetical protein [Luteolibacter marinus]|uniref:hypothetical protein n=1 Tax=Luteolibacter marinus TaxID=2776705 RepID=UPI0018676236|nr:hypothetical protein [Luteolibacter marinus]
MIRPLLISTLLATRLMAADTAVEEAADLLRFTNGNQIDGEFAGMDQSGVVTWHRSDVATPMPFKREKIRQIVLRNARPLSAMDSPCHVTLVNGDRIPGNVVAADDKSITLETTLAGPLILPREVVAAVSPNPFGGRLIYAGPFDQTGWQQVQSDGKMGILDEMGLSLPGTAPEEDSETPKPSWHHSGASWFSSGGNDAIILDAKMPDRALLRFKLGWRSRPNIAVAFHCDFTRPEPKEQDEKEDDAPARPNFGGLQNLANLFGTAYVINFQAGYIHLQRTGFDDDGNPEVERIRVGNSSIRLPDTGEAVFEIRCNRQEGNISVYIDDEFAVQWNTSDELEREVWKNQPRNVNYQAPGGGLGFQVQGNSASVRISDLVVAEWNGMTDSARSMESDHRDIVLLANGTDRFSGEVLAIRDGQVEIDASYGPLKIPLEDIAEIHFARDKRRKADEPLASEITVILQPVGRISGVPLASDAHRMQIDSPLAGKIDLDLAPAVVLEFQSGGGFLDDWDDAP